MGHSTSYAINCCVSSIGVVLSDVRILLNGTLGVPLVKLASVEVVVVSIFFSVLCSHVLLSIVILRLRSVMVASLIILADSRGGSSTNSAILAVMPFPSLSLVLVLRSFSLTEQSSVLKLVY